MRIFRRAVVFTAATGLLAFGAVAGSGGSAFASSDPWGLVTGCATYVNDVTVGYQPGCEALGGTTKNPTQIAIDVDTSALALLLADEQEGQGIDTSWNLVCSVDGSTVTVPGSYDITSVDQSPYVLIDPQTAVGSPEPNQCAVEDLEVYTADSLNSSDIEGGAFTLGVEVEADTAVPGAVYQEEGTTSAGANAVLCADDTANGNAGANIQSFECRSDLAESYVLTSSGQLVHNGDCVSLSGSNVVLAQCVADTTAQQWTQGHAGSWLKNVSTGTCLTAPSVKNGTQLTVKSCGSVTGQTWYIPAMSVITAPSFRPNWRAMAGVHHHK